MINHDKQSISSLYESVNKVSLNQRKVNYILENNTLSHKNKPELRVYLENVYKNDSKNYETIVDALYERASTNTLDENWWQSIKQGASNVMDKITPHFVQRGVADVKGRIHATQPAADASKLMSTLSDSVNKMNDIRARFAKYNVLKTLQTSISNGTLQSFITTDDAGNNVIPKSLTDFNNSVKALISSATVIKNEIDKFINSHTAPTPAPASTPSPTPTGRPAM